MTPVIKKKKKFKAKLASRSAIQFRVDDQLKLDFEKKLLKDGGTMTDFFIQSMHNYVNNKQRNGE